jgi:hypothetical protein
MAAPIVHRYRNTRHDHQAAPARLGTEFTPRPTAKVLFSTARNVRHPFRHEPHTPPRHHFHQQPTPNAASVSAAREKYIGSSPSHREQTCSRTSTAFFRHSTATRPVPALRERCSSERRISRPCIDIRTAIGQDDPDQSNRSAGYRARPAQELSARDLPAFAISTHALTIMLASEY